MSKKQNSVETGTVAEKPNFVRHMVGTYIDPKNQERMIIHVAFDPATLQLSEVLTERVAGNFEVQRERLMIKQASLGLLDDGNFPEEVKTKLY